MVERIEQDTERKEGAIASCLEQEHDDAVGRENEEAAPTRPSTEGASSLCSGGWSQILDFLEFLRKIDELKR